jgi:hypothetical protein
MYAKHSSISILFALSFFLIRQNVNAQLSTGTWLVGGAGKFYSYSDVISSATNNVDGKFTQVDLSIGVGYFPLDKLAVGLRPSFYSYKGEVSAFGTTNQQRYWIGPFARYYFLDDGSPNNVLVDASFQLGFYGGAPTGQLRTFSAAAGPVIFFNSSVGLEILFGYAYSKDEQKGASTEIRKGFQIGAGFQFHLEK